MEVADVFRRAHDRFQSRYGQSISRAQRRVMRDIMRCRTAALGGHAERCLDCGQQQIAYNSCRNRHCPKCQAGARAQWMDARASELLPVPYFHLVFTIPSELAPLALQNKRIVYGLLMRTVSETLKEVAANPRHLGAEIGGLAVLHTWGQNLMHHPHVHCVVPAGGLEPSGTKWLPCQRSKRTGKLFFLPVRILSRVFRGKFMAGLKRAFSRGRLQFHGHIAGLSDPRQFEQRLNAAVRQDWVVYAKRPFGSPKQVLKYLARYTHRVAIANSRLVQHVGNKVTFHWRDYAHEAQGKLMTLDDVEFIRRFLLHTLPRGFHRIRHFGFLANRHRAEKLRTCRDLLSVTSEKVTATLTETSGDDDRHPTVVCQVCGSNRVLRSEVLPCPPLQSRQQPLNFVPTRVPLLDSS